MNQLSAQDSAAQLENVLINGDLSKLAPSDRVLYYKSVCESVGLNPLTKPFDYLVLNGKTVLYAKRDATDQLRKIHGVSIRISSRESVGDVYVVTAQATDKTGRTDESTGAIVTASLKGDALANALMKAETKAKRRVTLSICGLGLLDEVEIEGANSAASASFGPAIGDSEISQLRDLIASTKTNETQFCSYFEIDTIESMPLSSYAKAQAMLITKQKKAQVTQ